MTDKKQRMKAQAVAFPKTIKSATVQAPDGAQRVFVNAALSPEEREEELREALAADQTGEMEGANNG